MTEYLTELELLLDSMSNYSNEIAEKVIMINENVKALQSSLTFAWTLIFILIIWNLVNGMKIKSLSNGVKKYEKTNNSLNVEHGGDDDA